MTGTPPGRAVASLASPFAKLGRAKAHCLALQNELSPAGPAWRDFGPYRDCPVFTERQDDGLEYLIRVRETQRIDPRWALIVGDSLFNLRATLDHLVYQLHVRRFRGTPPIDAAKASQFPIRCKPPTGKDPWKDIKRLSRRQQTAIKHLQPYVRRNDELRYVRRGLAQLHALNIIDKHRDLHVVWQSVGAMAVQQYPAEYGFRREPFYGGPLKEGAVVERWTFAKPPPEVPVHPGVFTEVTLIEARGVSVNVLILLETLINNVETILSRFAPYFPADP